jgi:dephospho-CoA kinase
MLKLFSVAVTGSIASGKSTVCQFFERWGAYVVDADRLLHQVFSDETPVGKGICSLFGERILKAHMIDRQRLAEAAFSNPQLLEKLEDICHPYVNEAIKAEYEKACKGDFAFFAAEVPLLFESRFSLAPWFDATIAVTAEKEIAIKRHLKKGLKQDQFAKCNSRQQSSQLKREKATYTIDNNGSLEELEQNAKKLFLELRSLQKQH